MGHISFPGRTTLWAGFMTDDCPRKLGPWKEVLCWWELEIQRRHNTALRRVSRQKWDWHPGFPLSHPPSLSCQCFPLVIPLRSWLAREPVKWRLNVCVHPTFTCWNLTSSGMVFGSLWDVGLYPQEWDQSPFVWNPGELPHPFLLVKCDHLHLGRGPSPDPDYADTLTSDLKTSQPWETHFYCL